MREDSYIPKTDTSKCWYKETCDSYGTDICRQSCKPFKQTDYLLQMSNLPVKKQNPARLDITYLSEQSALILPRILENIYSFVREGFNLYLYGDTGSGKTSWAIKIMNNYFASICEKNIYEPKGLYISTASFLRDAKLQMNYKSTDYYELLSTIQKCDIIIWDDICQTDLTSYESQCLYSYINERIFSKKCNIFTSNLSPEDLKNVDKRLYSRVCVGSDCVEMKGLDMRSSGTFTQSKFYTEKGSE